MKIRTLAALGATVALATPLIAAAPASARIIEHEHNAEFVSHIEQEEHGDEFCPNVDFPVLFTGDFREHVMVKTKGSSPFPYFSQNFRTEDTYTNTENDKSLRLLTVFNGSAPRITDNGDGTITVVFADKARTHAFGPDGERLFVDTGQFRATLLIDYNGTPTDVEDDIELDFQVVKETGRNDTADRDFCEDLVIFLG
ncbi:MAG TPA: hypothetical protein VFG98_00310 [Intrasporangium sp.]|nr:hypothetical protein [Intrasporangium sp.]